MKNRTIEQEERRRKENEKLNNRTKGKGKIEKR